jgi:hypothetical protein
MAEQLYQVRNLYRDVTLNGFVLRAGKKARVKVVVDPDGNGKYRGVARLLEAGGAQVAEAAGETPDETFEAVVNHLYDEQFNFVARLDQPPAAERSERPSKERRR